MYNFNHTNDFFNITGEVAAIERPENALLEEHLDYETVSKQAPIITEEVSKRLEDIIKQRIKGQLISKCLFGAIVSNQKPKMKNKEFLP